MLSVALALCLASAGLVFSSPVNQNVTSSYSKPTLFSSCATKMDGELPYYQPQVSNSVGTSVNTMWQRRSMPGITLQVTWGYISSNESIGSSPFDKALYRGYTGPDFSERLEQPGWLGFNGPVIRSEVNDMIENIFINRMDNFYASMHSMGLFHTKESAGSLSYNGTEANAKANAVPPGGCVVYKWLVGPGSIPEEGNDSKFWAYHSYVSMYQDADAGVRGPFIAYNQGKMDEVTANNCEFTLFYGDNQESNSFFAMQNIQKYLPDVYPTIANTTDTYPMSTMNQTFWAPQVINSPLNTITTKMAPNFFPITDAKLVNGYIFANNPPFEICVNEQAIWNLMDMSFDTHVVHWHGNNVVKNGLTITSVPINPGMMTTTTMTALNPGWWQVICYFNTHLGKGMGANYRIYGLEEGACPLPRLPSRAHPPN